MARTTVLLTRRTDMWRAWIGFNLSHSLGALLLGVVVLLAGRSAAVFRIESGLFVPMAFLVSTAYLVLAMRFWFRTPIIGIGLSVALFAVAWMLRWLGQ